MNKKLEDLTYGELTEIHNQYRKLGSLKKTCEWIKDTFQVTIDRFRLSAYFKEQGFDVNPPNGREVQHWRDTTKYSTKYGEFAGAILRGLWQDIFHWQNTQTGWINYASACVTVGTNFYDALLGTLLQGVDNDTINVHVIPPGITPEIIASGREKYEQGYRHWVLNNDSKIFSN